MQDIECIVKDLLQSGINEAERKLEQAKSQLSSGQYSNCALTIQQLGIGMYTEFHYNIIDAVEEYLNKVVDSDLEQCKIATSRQKIKSFVADDKAIWEYLDNTEIGCQ